MAQVGDSIIWAIKNGDLDQVKELVEQNKFNVNQEITTRSPIHYAADYGQTDVLKYLITKGADVNVGFYSRIIMSTPSALSSPIISFFFLTRTMNTLKNFLCFLVSFCVCGGILDC